MLVHVPYKKKMDVKVPPPKNIYILSSDNRLGGRVSGTRGERGLESFLRGCPYPRTVSINFNFLISKKKKYNNEYCICYSHMCALPVGPIGQPVLDVSAVVVHQQFCYWEGRRTGNPVCITIEYHRPF